MSEDANTHESEARRGSAPVSGDGSPEMVGGYRLIRELGRGGQAVVWLAADTRLGRHVALKLLHQTVADSAVLDRFRREASVTSRLNHPSICPIYEVGLDGIPYIAMRFVEGETLAKQIKRARAGEDSTATTMPEEAPTVSARSSGGPGEGKGAPADSTAAGRMSETLALFEKLALALQSAHDAGVVHRDIKPGNVIVERNGNPILLDFGVAATNDADGGSLTVSGQLLGTPAYMPPEQLLGPSSLVGPQSDVYSLGVTLYETLTLERPFSGPTREALCRAILEETLTDPRTLNKAIGRDLAVVVACAMRRDVRRRYATAAAFAEDLRRVRELEPIAARPPSPFLKLRRWAQRNRALAAVLAFAVLLVLTVLVTSLLLLRSERQRREAESVRADALAREAESERRFRQLADPAVLRHLVARADELWPRRTERLDEMERWLSSARALAGEVGARQADLQALRSAALPRESQDAEAEERLRRRLHPALYRDIDAAERAIAYWEAKLDGRRLGKGEARRLEQQVDGTQENLDELLNDPRTKERVLWRFDSEAKQRRHDAMTELVRSAPRLRELIADVEQRSAMAGEIERRSLVEAKDDWRRCIADLERLPVYESVKLTPQVGLWPLGRDGRSGLWEFWYVESGERPEWDEEAACVEMSDESGLVFVLLPGGRFFQGTQSRDPEKPGYDPAARAEERHVVEIELAPFFMSKFETTQQQWKLIVGKNPSQNAFDGTLYNRATRLHPVERVTWEEAGRVAFRLGLLLPTEEQWEYATRGGTTTPWWTGAEAASLDGMAHLHGERHQPVGTSPPNPFGLHETLGNLSEWTRSRFGPYDNPPRPGDGYRSLPDGFPGSEDCVFRGGHFKSRGPEHARSASRGHAAPSYHSAYVGVRFARPVSP